MTSTSAQRASTQVFMPVLEVFDLIGLHSNTGYQLIKRGDFPVPVVHIGGRMYCRHTDVRAFIEGSSDE